ncbi:hypothetical protein Bca4012_034866 [Brassica carinata]
MDSSREAKHEQEEEVREDEAAASLVDLNLMVVLLSQLCTKDDEDDHKNLEKERRDHVAHEIRESRARANKRFMKETKLMEKRTHVLQPMAKEFRSRRM